MANIPGDVGSQSIAQLTCVLAAGVRVSFPCVITDNIGSLVSQGMVDDVRNLCGREHGYLSGRGWRQCI